VKTAITDMFDIRYPILAFTHSPQVVVAASKAGGLGVLGASTLTAAKLAEGLQWIEDHVEGHPYGIDLMIPAKHADKKPVDVGASIPEGHRRFVTDLLAEHDVTPFELEVHESEFTVGMMSPAEHAEQILRLALDFPIKLIASALGPPYPHMVAAGRQHDIRIAALAGTVKHAHRNVEAGAELIIAQGTEAGAHAGDITTMVLVPEIVDAVAPVPVLAAGGIGRGRQVAAAMALGAEGVWCGSVWLTTQESDLEEVEKDMLLQATSSDTVRSLSRTGKPCRQTRSAWTNAWEAKEAPPILPMPLQHLLSVPAMDRCLDDAVVGHRGARELVSVSVGQIVGAMKQIKSTQEVIDDMVQELNAAQQNLSGKLSS
jgi:NAD(P)H-dependent flavin oxidoreductase YrpB (nitropropane dioxygenase family)